MTSNSQNKNLSPLGHIREFLGRNKLITSLGSAALGAGVAFTAVELAKGPRFPVEDATQWAAPYPVTIANKRDKDGNIVIQHGHIQMIRYQNTTKKPLQVRIIEDMQRQLPESVPLAPGESIPEPFDARQLKPDKYFVYTEVGGRQADSATVVVK